MRALLTADKNQTFTRSRMSEAEQRANPAFDYRPFIIADATRATAASSMCAT